MSGMRLGKIIKSNSHTDYICQVYAAGEVGQPPARQDYAFGTFVRVELGGDRWLVGIIYDAMLFNPEFVTTYPAGVVPNQSFSKTEGKTWQNWISAYFRPMIGAMTRADFDQCRGGNSMSDKERVLKELEKRIRTGKALERVGGIYEEIADAYDEGSEKAVSELLKTKIASLKGTYDRTHTTLLEKMGL